MSNSFATPWIIAHQDPLPMGFSKQEYWSEFPFPTPGDLPDPGIKPVRPASQADSLPLSHHREDPVYKLPATKHATCNHQWKTQGI